MEGGAGEDGSPRFPTKKTEIGKKKGLAPTRRRSPLPGGSVGYCDTPAMLDEMAGPCLPRLASSYSRQIRELVDRGHRFRYREVGRPALPGRPVTSGQRMRARADTYESRPQRPHLLLHHRQVVRGPGLWAMARVLHRRVGGGGTWEWYPRSGGMLRTGG